MDPEYIPETESFSILKTYIYKTFDTIIQKATITMALDLLRQILFQMYKITDYGLLVKRATQYISESQVFSTTLSAAIEHAEWSQNTSKNIVCILKKILKSTTLNHEFIMKLQWRQIKIISEKQFPNYIQQNEEKLKRYQEWIKIIKEKSNNKSILSLRTIIVFFDKILPKLGLDPFTTDNLEAVKIRVDKNLIEEFSNSQRRWLSLLLNDILHLDIEKFGHNVKISKIIEDDGSDKHRIPTIELEKIYAETKKTVRDELMYLLLITTGMRIGGLVRIKLEHVASIEDTTVTVKSSGRTLEKGSKWFTFIINNRVSHLIMNWCKGFRPSNGSPYLFSGRGSNPHIHEASVRRIFHGWCSAAGLEGKHLHPHSIRHSYAHILLEAGNDIYNVSRLLGHSNVSTTEMFYLKETAADVARRSNIPWLNKSEEPSIPKFLVSKHDVDRKKRMKNMAKIASFKINEQN